MAPQMAPQLEEKVSSVCLKSGGGGQKLAAVRLLRYCSNTWLGSVHIKFYNKALILIRKFCLG